MRYLRHSHVGEAGTSSVEFNKGWAIYKAIKVTESLQSPYDHKELIGGGQQLKRGTIRSRSVSQQGQGVSKTAWWVPDLWSRCSEVQQFLTPYCGADQDELFFPGSPHTTVLHWGEGAGIRPDLIPTWNLNRGPGKCSIYSIQDSEAQLISISWNPNFPKDSEKGSQDGHMCRSSSTKAMTWHHWSYVS